MPNIDTLLLNKKLLTEEEFKEYFSEVKNMSYLEIKNNIFNNSRLNAAQLDGYYGNIKLRTKFSLHSGMKKLMIQGDHVEQFYWEVRFFMKEAFTDIRLGYPYEAYLFSKIIMLKTAFIYWLAFTDKIKEYAKNIDKLGDFEKLYEKWGLEGSEKITWLNKITSFRSFANDIKHNLDYLTEIQNADRNNSHWSEKITEKSIISAFSLNSYDLNLVNDFFYQECFKKLLVAFNEYIGLFNSFNE